MRVALVNLTGGGLSGGYRKYLRRIVPLLTEELRISRLSVFVPPGTRIGAEETDFLTWSRQDAFTGFRRLRARVRESGADVVFIPTARWLKFGGTPVVVMVRNMEPLLSPLEGNPISTKARNLARALVARRACRKADRVIAVSRHVSDFLVRRWGVESERIGVVPHGADESLGPDERTRPPMVGSEAGSFAFTAGSLRPARGLRDLVEAVARMREAGAGCDVVVGGRADPDSTDYVADLKRELERRGIGDRFTWAGQLSPAEMSWCFSNCRVFVMTSRAEACPNTVLEALSHGCLSVSTDQAPMPEFFGDSAIYYEARNAESLAARLAEAWGIPEPIRRAYREAAMSRVPSFTWRKTVDRTVEELELAIARGRTGGRRPLERAPECDPGPRSADRSSPSGAP